MKRTKWKIKQTFAWQLQVNCSEENAFQVRSSAFQKGAFGKASDDLREVRLRMQDNVPSY